MFLPSTLEIIRHFGGDEETNRELIMDFFVLFSRIEYAMKQTTRYRRGTSSQPKADWSKLSEDMSHFIHMPDNHEVALAIQRLTDNPPKKVVVIENMLKWESVNAVDKQEVFFQIACVRNNLFHGGKFLEDIEKRDISLIEDSCLILKYCLEKIPELNDYYSAL